MNITHSEKWLKGKVLDVGCGSDKIPNAIGIDNDPQSLGDKLSYNKKHKSDADCIMDCRNLGFKDNVFDAIRSNHVLEHMTPKEIIKTFREFQRVLKSGGYMVHCCAAGQDIWDHFDHERPYPPKALEDLCNAIGFKVVVAMHLGFPGISHFPNWLVKIVGKKKTMHTYLVAQKKPRFK